MRTISTIKVFALFSSIVVFCAAGEKNQGHSLMMMMTANKSETTLYRAPTSSLLLVSHGGITKAIIIFCGTGERN